MAEQTETEREIINKAAQEQINPMTGEAHYYKVKLEKLDKHYRFYLPRPECDEFVGDETWIKVFIPRTQDNYLVIQKYGSSSRSTD